ncbi:MAG: hypothetical protein RI894_1680, partial [Bacteroidota bacterium]
EDELIHQPHDKFFRATFGDITVVRGHLQAFLPQEVSDLLDFDGLVRDNTSYVSEALKAHYSDVVWNLNYHDAKIKIAVLFEHKTTSDKYIALQLLRYMQEIWDADMTAYDDLTLVIPIVVYQGLEAWKHRRFEDLFPGISGIFLRYLPSFTYERTDVNEQTEAILTHHRAHKNLLVFQVMRHVATRNLGPDVLFELLSALVNTEHFGSYNDKFAKEVLSYLFNYSDVKPIEIIEKIRLLSLSNQEKYMSTLNQFYIEGISLGEARGEARGLLLTAKIIKQHIKGFSAAAIAESLAIAIEMVQTAIEEYEAS